ncbi:anti-sigma factor [Nocardia sp. NPDC050712]|uniref:anti-sigma factor n=1 Tax=Nocardia sp. NPDC050712 TaxID=3155518 RepID=UPI0033D78616
MPDIHPHSELLELAYPYALDALSDEDRRAVEHMLEHADEPTADAFRSTVRDLRETLATMTVLDAVPAPPSVEQTLLELLDAQAGPTGKPAGPAGASAWRRNSRRWLAVAAAAAILAGAGAGITVFRSQSQDSGQVTAQQVLDQSDVQEKTLPLSNGGTITVNASKELGTAIVSFDGVPAPPTAHTYQLWLIAGGDQVRSAGVVAPLPTASAPMLMSFGDAGTLAVSIEPSGGSPQPTTDPVVGVPLA